MGLRMFIIEGCDVTERHEEACEGRSDRLREAPRGQLPFQRKRPFLVNASSKSEAF